VQTRRRGAAKRPRATQVAVGLPSIDVVKPDEEGGPIARSGHAYQDEIAVSLLLDMLENPALLKIHCETHDDLVLVYAVSGSDDRIAEFVQVKSHEMEQLWSVANLCERTGGRAGTSLLEKSLSRDKHQEIARFRLVTVRPVVNDLKLLALPFGATGREAESAAFRHLQQQLESRRRGVASPKGNGAAYWMANCHWDVRYTVSEVRKDNLLRLIRLGEREAIPLLPEPANLLLDELLRWVKLASDARWVPDRDKKIITREALRAWWETRAREVTDGAKTTSGGKLREKMNAAHLPADVIELAVDLRRGYADVARTPRYMASDEVHTMQLNVKTAIATLRARFVAGELDVDARGFHALCLQLMDEIAAEESTSRSDSAFLKGCMYDIADRCLLRFERRLP
jgi:hypothetical protein